MTVDQYIAGLNAKISQLETIKKEAASILKDAHLKRCQLVFEGRANLGSYSTKPTLAGSNVLGYTSRFGTKNYSFVRRSGSDKYFGSKKKVSEQKWVTKMTPKGPRNLIVIQGGYAEIRQADGRQTGTVDLRWSGILERDVRSSFTETSTGFVAGVRRDENVPKLEGAIKRYGDKLDIPKDILDEANQKLARNFVKLLLVT